MKPLIILCRPLNCFMAAATSLLGSWLPFHDLSSINVWIAALTVGLITAGGNVMNDISDLTGDRINHPDRPLVNGEVTRAWAIGMLSLTWGLAALLSALVLDSISANIVVLVLVLITLYNFVLKGLPVIGNLTIAAVTWFVLQFGAIAVAGGNQLFFPPLLETGAIMAALLHLAREMVKSVQDIEGDRAQKRLTLPMLIGNRIAIAVAIMPILAMPFVSYVLLKIESYHLQFLWVVSLLTAGLVFVGISSALSPKPSTISLFSRSLKIAMALGLLLLLAVD
jgi:geranylgeranylglycerol-phosphate geranylgeranyltransferase